MITHEQAAMIHDLRHVIHAERTDGKMEDDDQYYLRRCELAVDLAGVDLTQHAIIFEPLRLRGLWYKWRRTR